MSHCSQKKLNNTLVFLKIAVPNIEKNPEGRMKLPVKFRAEDLHRAYCRYFRTNLLVFQALLLILSIFDGTNIHRTILHRKTFIYKLFA